MTLIKNWSNNQCALQYKIGTKEYNEYWYNDTKNILKDYQFIIINSLLIPMEMGNGESVKFLKEFCRLMTLENKIVIYDNEEFIRYLESVGSNAYYDACCDILEEVLILSGFYCIQADCAYNYKDVYIYAQSLPGIMVYETIMEFYGYTEDDY